MHDLRTTRARASIARTARRLLALTLLLTLSRPAAGAIHVGEGQAYPTLYAASRAHAVHPGDTVLLHGGIYRDTQGPIDSLIGRPDAWITIRPFGTDSVSIHTQYTFQHAQYLRIEDLHWAGNDPAVAASVFHLLYFDYAYDCFGSIHDLVIRGCSFTDLDNTGKGSTGACLKLTGTERFVVEQCRFERGTNITDGISLNADRHGLIQDCLFASMPGDGSHCKGGTLDITYTRNTFIDCVAGGLDVGGDTGPAFFCPLAATWEADSIHVIANLFFGGTTGIKLSSCHNSEILQNTCYKSTQFAFRSLNASSNAIYLKNNLIENNIFTTNGPYGIYLNASSGYDFSTETFRNNLFHDYAHPDPAALNWSELPGVVVSGSIIADPRFTDTAQRDLTLRAGSPAIHAGLARHRALLDIAHHPYDTAAPTIGAHEYGTLLQVTERPQSTPLLLAPVPASDHVTISLPTTLTQSQSGTPLFISIIDVLGRLRLRVPCPWGAPTAFEVDLHELPAGSYHVRLEGTRERLESTLIIRR